MEFSIRCQNCSFSHLCIPFSLSDSEISVLDDIIRRNKPLQPGQCITEYGKPLTSLFAVRSGSFKSYIMSADGEQQITGFHLPGDIIGFDGLSTQSHQSFTQALETSMVCEIPYTMLDDMSSTLPALRRQMTKLMSEEISHEQQVLMLINKRNAQERIIHFLLNLSARFKARGMSGSSFNLTMTRGEIGNYLGLTVETVSRILSKLNKQNLISVDGKLIELLSIDGLKEELSDSAPLSSACR
ncbi:fumarate/nitrate reduction transcriptional regulator Fnr [Aestuariibacter sp. AA17]|uniref:Fumarate/nitrate reduction transcriptional regulator Fnr n=1 Tax=Fluctibacter corallii TaxID=2984329 RepID=A0ABT3A6M0_9ALTE|nr:fumarate/nitrate reduction transcriptional regulator Fnr [Aestuariibacter sp. AA17]MCV2884214.1 fumarate/nitrate reduction transcriptional regulator Fnr [Aestuariibacter sp. AA17]